MKEVHFLVRKQKRGTPEAEKLPKSVAVVSISDSIDSAHFVFAKTHHSLDFHPELNRYVKDAPAKHRHFRVKLKGDHLSMYINSATNEFHFKGQKLQPWNRPLGTLTGSKSCLIFYHVQINSNYIFNIQIAATPLCLENHSPMPSCKTTLICLHQVELLQGLVRSYRHHQLLLQSTLLHLQHLVKLTNNNTHSQCHPVQSIHRIPLCSQHLVG